MQNLIPFQFGQSEVRVSVGDDGQPWFNANDVCEVLQFGNARQALESHVDAEDVQKLDTLTAGGPQQANYVNESGLYALIFGSTKPEAKKFKRWVTSEVLPAIRKTGRYSTPTSGDRSPTEWKPFKEYGFDLQALIDTMIQQVHADNPGNLAWAIRLLDRVRNDSNQIYRGLLAAQSELDRQAQVLASLRFPCTEEQDKAQVRTAQHIVDIEESRISGRLIMDLCKAYILLWDFDAVKELRRRIP